MALIDDFDAQELLALAQYDVEQGHLESALKKLKLVAQHDNPIPVGLVMLAKLYARLRLFHYAKEYYGRYLALDPASAEVNFEYGMVHFDMGETDKAIATWSELLATQPTYPPALFYSALVSSRLDKHADARRHLDVLLQSTDKDNLYYIRGRELLAELSAMPGQQSDTAPPVAHLAS